MHRQPGSPVGQRHGTGEAVLGLDQEVAKIVGEYPAVTGCNQLRESGKAICSAEEYQDQLARPPIGRIRLVWGRHERSRSETTKIVAGRESVAAPGTGKHHES